MSKLKPLSWVGFVRHMRKFGFSGPYQEGRHPYMIKGNLSVAIPNPHGEDLSADLINRILKQAGIKRSDWVK